MDEVVKISIPILNMMLVTEFLAVAICAAKTSIAWTRNRFDRGCTSHRALARYLQFVFLSCFFYAIGEYTWIANGSYLKICHTEDIMWVLIEMSAAFAMAVGLDVARACIKCHF